MDRNAQMIELRRNTDLTLADIGRMFKLKENTVGNIFYHAGVKKGERLQRTFTIMVDGKEVTLARRY